MGTKQFDSATDLITFTRASSSTFLGSNGLIQTATNNTPRIEYNADGTVKGLLIEEARTNLLPYSNQANQLVYHSSGVTTGVDTTEVTSPAGSGTAIKLNKTSSGYGFARVHYSSVTNAQTFSSFVKKGTARYIGFRQLASSGTHTTFDLENNTWVQTAGSTSRGYEDYGNGWLRLFVVSDDSNSKTLASLVITNASGAESSSETGTVYVYGLQREAGAFPMSYIPTSGSTATRAADVATIPTSAFGYNDDAGTVLLNVTFLSTNVSNNAGMDLWNNISTKISFRKALFLGNTGGAQWGLAGIGTNSELFAGSFKENNVVQCSNGTLSSVDTSALIPQGITKLDMSRVDQGSFPLNGHIKSIKYYPRRLSNAQLQELTT